VGKIHNGVCLKEELCFGAEQYVGAMQYTPFKGSRIEEREKRMLFHWGILSVASGETIVAGQQAPTL